MSDYYLLAVLKYMCSFYVGIGNADGFILKGHIDRTTI